MKKSSQSEKKNTTTTAGLKKSFPCRNNGRLFCSLAGQTPPLTSLSLKSPACHVNPLTLFNYCHINLSPTNTHFLSHNLGGAFLLPVKSFSDPSLLFILPIPFPLSPGTRYPFFIQSIHPFLFLWFYFLGSRKKWL